MRERQQISDHRELSRSFRIRATRRPGPGPELHRSVNTFYMNAALEQLQAEGYPVREEDLARLSPCATRAARAALGAARPRSSTTLPLHPRSRAARGPGSRRPGRPRAGPGVEGQPAALKAAHCTRIFSEKISTRIKVRPELEKARWRRVGSVQSQWAHRGHDRMGRHDQAVERLHGRAIRRPCGAGRRRLHLGIHASWAHPGNRRRRSRPQLH